MQAASQAHIRRLAKLRLKKYRLEYSRFLLSGWNTVQSALRSPFLSAQALYVTEAAGDDLKRLRLNAALPVFRLTEKEAAKISEERHPQGIFLEAQLPQFAAPDFSAGQKSLYLHEVNDPGNLGTIIRTALRFGFRQMLLSPHSADPYQPKVVRASTGYVTHMRIYEGITSRDVRRWREAYPLFIVGTAVTTGRPLHHLRLKKQQALLLMFGSEAHGLNEELLRLCDQRVTIGGEQEVESLNLAVSAGIILNYCYTEERKVRNVR